MQNKDPYSLELILFLLGFHIALGASASPTAEAPKVQHVINTKHL